MLNCIKITYIDGGRISSIKASIGSLLKITPVLKVQNGLVVQNSAVRGLC